MEHEENNNSSGELIGLLIIIGLVWFFFFRQSNTWDGFYYPNEGNLTYSIQSPQFKTLEECRDWVDEQIQTYNPSGYGYDYECGKNCKYKDGLTVQVCETTEH